MKKKKFCKCTKKQSFVLGYENWKHIFKKCFNCKKILDHEKTEKEIDEWFTNRPNLTDLRTLQ